MFFCNAIDNLSSLLAVKAYFLNNRRLNPTDS